MSDVSQPSTVITVPNVASLATGANATDVVVVPFNAELLNVSVYANTGPTVTNGTYDIMVAPPGTAIGAATSVFLSTAVVANLAQAITSTSATVIYVSQAITATATQVVNQVVESVTTPPIALNQVLLIGTEIVQVTGIQGGAGAFGVGGGTSQSKIVLDPNIQALTVTRGFLGSTAATALVQATVLAQVPTLAPGTGANTGAAVYKPSLPLIVAGSLLQIKVLVQGTAAATNGSFSYHLAKR